MKNSIFPLLLLTIFSSSLSAQTLSPEEEICKNFVEKEMFERGMVNKRVCLNTNNYPNISINTNLSDIESGKSDKPLETEDIKAMGGLEYLLSETLKDVKDAKKEVVGYTDGEIAVFKSHDDKFFKPVNGVGPQQYQDSIKDGTNYSMELDKEKVNAYIAGIKDPATKNKLTELMKSSDLKVTLKKSKNEFAPQGPNQLLVDILRNHALSIARTDDFCNKLANPELCKKDQKGVTSVDLLEKSNSSTDKTFAAYHGQCGGRRGVSYNFYFPDEVKKNQEYEPGVYEPSFNIPGRDFQNKMQLSASMDFMRKIKADASNFPEIDAKKTIDMEKSKNFTDIEADRTRFKSWLNKGGSKCGDNQYQVDNQRRLFWAMQKEMIDSKKVVKSDKSGKKENYEKLLEGMQGGDFASLKSNPEFAQIYELATFPKKHGDDYLVEVQKDLDSKYKFSKEEQGKLDKLVNLKNKLGTLSANDEMEITNLQKKKNDGDAKKDVLKNPATAQMVCLMRTMVIGRPVNHKDFGNNLSEEDSMNRFHIYDGSAPDTLFNQGVSMKPYSRYAGKEGATRIGDIAYPPADVYACHDVTDALVDNMKENSQSLVKGLGRTGEENSNTWDNVKFDVGSVKSIETDSSNAGYNNEKLAAWQNLEKEGYLAPGSVKGTSMNTMGWVCQECGSGVHVHPDGSVHPVSRNRVGYEEVSEVANQSFDVTKNDNFSMNSLQHLKMYVFKNCQNCECTKNFKNGNDLKQKLASEGEIHSMVTYNDQGKPVIDPEKNKFKVEDPTSCIYVAPVPHSCNYDPAGESLAKKENKKKRDELYCKLKTLISSKAYGEKYPKIKTDLQDEYKAVMSKCQKSVFPQSEASCLEKFTKKGNGQTSGTVEKSTTED